MPHRLGRLAAYGARKVAEHKVKTQAAEDKKADDAFIEKMRGQEGRYAVPGGPVKSFPKKAAASEQKDGGYKRPMGAVSGPDPKRVPKPGSDSDFIKRMQGGGGLPDLARKLKEKKGKPR